MSVPRPSIRPVVEPDTSGPDLGMLENRMGYALRRAQLAVFQDFYKAVAAHDISAAQYSALTIVESNPGLSQTQVADTLGIKKANFVALIKALETRGLVERRTTPKDKRSFALHLTDAGTVLINTLHRLSDHHEDRIRKAIGDKAYYALFAPLAQIARLGL
jgi:DNA-binding MarR family transcriptional regulator